MRSSTSPTRSVKGDVLGEIRKETNYRFLGDAALIGTAHGEGMGRPAREIFIACYEPGTGTASDIRTTSSEAMATAGGDQLAMLCQGTAARD